MTKPEKNALIQPMIKVCETIIATFPFIAPIMPSMAFGSVNGFGGGFPLLSGSARNLPSFTASAKAAFLSLKCEADKTDWLFRRLIARISCRCSRTFAGDCFFGALVRRTVA